MRKFLVAAAAVVGLIAAAFASVAQADTDDDLECLSVMVYGYRISTEQGSSTGKDGSMLGILYYLGRLQGRDGQAPWLDRAMQLSLNFNADDRTTRVLAKCSNRLTEQMKGASTV